MPHTPGSGTVLATGTYDVRAHPRVAVLVEGLRESGWDVEEIVEPLRLSTAERVEVLRRPVLLPRLARAIGRAWWHLTPRLRRRRRSGPRPAAVLVGYLGHFDVVLVRALLRPAPVVLDFLVSGADTAKDRGESGRVKGLLLSVLDDLALRCADVVLVDTEEHRATLPERHRSRAVVVPVGADARWHAEGAARRPAPAGRRLSVVFFGLFTPLQGVTTIARALRELGGEVDATVIGTGQEWAEARRIVGDTPHVDFREWVVAEELPAVVASHDVCLGIFGTGDKAFRVVPNKVYQGAAAGCVVVTSDTPAQRRALGEHGVYVPAGDASALADELRRLAREHEQRADLSAGLAAAARERFAPGHVVAPLVGVLTGR